MQPRYCNAGTRMGANVIVTEVQPIRALEAAMNGFRVMPMSEAARWETYFVTAPVTLNVIRKEHMPKMKDGAIMCNSGHFNVEISIPDLESLSKGKRTIRPNMEEYTLSDGRKLYLLAEGRLVNLLRPKGTPPKSWTCRSLDQALSSEYIAKSPKMQPKVYLVPKELDEKVAELKLNSMGVKIDALTEEQKKYLSTWEMGTT